jgi:hypothetical protein
MRNTMLQLLRRAGPLAGLPPAARAPAGRVKAAPGARS